MIPILGMHRSGTSALAGALHKLGANFGDESTWIPPAPDNPLGFFENARFVDINRKILAVFGGTWSSPPALPPGWIDDERLWDARERATEFVTESPHDLVVKDPRLSLVLPLWDEISRPRPAVHCVRHPLATASSLERRNGFPIETGLFLWFRYVAASLLYRPDAMIVRYEQLLEEPHQTLARVAAHIGHTCSDETVAVAVSSLRPEMAHEQALPLPATPIAAACAELITLIDGGDQLDNDAELLRLSRLVTELPWGGPATREIRIATRRVRELEVELEQVRELLGASEQRGQRLERELGARIRADDRSAFNDTVAVLAQIRGSQ